SRTRFVAGSIAVKRYGMKHLRAGNALTKTTLRWTHEISSRGESRCEPGGDEPARERGRRGGGGRGARPPRILTDRRDPPDRRSGPGSRRCAADAGARR